MQMRQGSDDEMRSPSSQLVRHKVVVKKVMPTRLDEREDEKEEEGGRVVGTRFFVHIFNRWETPDNTSRFQFF